DYNFKQDYQYFFNPKNTFLFGFNAVHHTFTPGELTSTGGDSTFKNDVSKKYAIEYALYLSHEYSMTDYLKFSYGLRYSGFALIGPSNIYTYNQLGEVINNKYYNDGELIEYYGGLEPRASVNYLIGADKSIKAAYTRNMQYLHLLSNTTSTTPLDIWQPSTNNVKPGISDQISLGYYQNFKDNQYEASIEGYYKYLQNQIDYKNGADLLLNKFVESELVYGKGWVYGIEFFLRKNWGDLTGWISYTYSKSERQFDAIDNGNPFPAKYDRTHDFSIVASYNLTPKWNFSATWVFNTGNAVTYPSGKYKIGDNIVNLYSERNGYRMPDYHRLDIGITYTFEKHGSFGSSLNFTIYNAYGQKNAYSISFKENESDPTKTDAVMKYLFTFFPSLTYNFHF
ncbi:MAG: hypothetical protein QG635_1354, partial [Bacteroidota bacterium]|nr:hypothetical protein [Bacteroidota bacterium]